MVVLAIHRQFQGRYGAGHWKDLVSIKAVLGEIVADFKPVVWHRTDFKDLLGQLNEDVTDVIVYYSFWPELVRFIKKKLPRIRVHVRTVNAEALQHWQRSSIRPTPAVENVRNIYGFVRLLWRDRLCRKYADSLLGISDWDNRNYWKKLPGKAEIRLLEYVCPWERVRPGALPLPWERRKNLMLCMAGGRDPIGSQMTLNFYRLAENFGRSDRQVPWSFACTTGVTGAGRSDQAPSNVRLIDGHDEPWDLLRKAKVVAVLTSLGFGMKTTIIDALSARCHVLVQDSLYRRLPEEIARLCVCLKEGSEPSPALLRRFEARHNETGAVLLERKECNRRILREVLNAE